MPTYSFRCDLCGRTTDIVRRIADRDAPAFCDAEALRGNDDACLGFLLRQPTAASFSVKGHSARNSYGLKGDN